VQGANDPRVTKAESDQIVAALRARGVSVQYLVADDEGHGFVKPENRMEAYGAIERFFAAHLGGRSES
jgi:dipeptidyl aminopeptidase/acylaminoacyl peptidase